MSKIIKDEWDEKIIRKSREWHWKDLPSAGFSFDCDEQGRILPLNSCAQKNYEMCLKNEEGKLVDDGIVTYKNVIHHRASVRCNCGNEFELYNYTCGACECDNCGQWFNLFGQEILPPNQWEEF